jgi:hypothetical protein
MINMECWSPGISLEGLVISIISMLDDPTVEDPLVPEIAATYIQDREQYNQNARAYTQRYATDLQSYPDWGVCPFSDLPAISSMDDPEHA